MATGKPVRGARLVAELVAPVGGDAAKRHEVVGDAVSDTAGRVQIEKIPVGTIGLSVSAPGYAARGLGQERYGERTFRQYQVELGNGTFQFTEVWPGDDGQQRKEPRWEPRVDTATQEAPS